MAFGECQQVWPVRAKQVGKCRQVWRVRATRLGECPRVWRELAKPLDECWLKQDRSFYAQITYFICIKRSSLHSLNSPNSPNLLNLHKTCQTCLLRVWRVLAKWFGECRRVWRARATWLGECRRVWQVQHISKKGHFGEYSNSLNSLASGHSLIKIQYVSGAYYYRMITQTIQIFYYMSIEQPPFDETY
jgi:hypothetical protein